uniref:Protein vav n=2 Tax=Globodera pallida TaxID=36090 RepID=A0A183BNS4_GLOPA
MPQAMSGLGELWEQCLQWLGSTGVLDPREQFTKLSDFAAILRNGVLLCELALRLKPDCIDRHEILMQYQQSPFTCSKNIGLFLSACRLHFGIEHLFDEDDLYGLHNFGAVLRLLSQLSRSQTSRQLGLKFVPDGGGTRAVCTLALSICLTRTTFYGLHNFGAVLRLLSQLSRSQTSRQLGFKPFPEETTLPCELDDEDNNNIYSNLRDEVEQLQHDVVQYLRLNGNGGSASGSGSTDDERREEDGRQIYDTICGQAVVPQTGSKTLPISYAKFTPTTKRECCLMELLDTEINYDNALQRIDDIFYSRLHFYLNAEDMATIFINIREILRVNLHFLAKLEPAVLHALNIENRRNIAAGGEAPPAPLSVAELFITFKERFTAYAMYCSLLGKSTSRIDELERNDPEFKQLVANLSRDEQFRLQALVFLPFQRITKYHLLLDSLAKYTTHDLVEQAALNIAYESMKDVCDYVNEMKRDHDTIEYINTIARSISGLDLSLAKYTTHDLVEQAALNIAYESMKDVCDYVNEMKRDHDTIEYINTIARSISGLDLVRRAGVLMCRRTQTASSQSVFLLIAFFEK